MASGSGRPPPAAQLLFPAVGWTPRPATPRWPGHARGAAEGAGEAQVQKVPRSVLGTVQGPGVTRTLWARTGVKAER